MQTQHKAYCGESPLSSHYSMESSQLSLSQAERGKLGSGTAGHSTNTLPEKPLPQAALCIYGEMGRSGEH